MILTNNSSDVPTVHITTNRNRVKTYGSIAYMKSGTNFEIEIFNPTQGRLLSKIKIDGREISSNGIVINPGQRVYLERWIDEAKKFKFSTYEVENSAPAKKAIEQNGKIEVSLYSETINLSNNWINWTNSGTTNINNYPYTLTTNTFGGSFGGTTTTDLYYTNNSFYSSSMPLNSSLGCVGNNGPSGIRGKAVTDGMLNEKAVETGRTEKGEKSDQDFDETTGDFGSWPMMTVSLQILPESAKPVEVEKIRSYCTECGTRVRATSWKFCPSCGEKL
jgi:hypothetical protein